MLLRSVTLNKESFKTWVMHQDRDYAAGREMNDCYVFQFGLYSGILLEEPGNPTKRQWESCKDWRKMCKLKGTNISCRCWVLFCKAVGVMWNVSPRIHVCQGKNEQGWCGFKSASFSPIRPTLATSLSPTPAANRQSRQKDGRPEYNWYFLEMVKTSRKEAEEKRRTYNHSLPETESYTLS